jgi:hypothetical protein
LYIIQSPITNLKSQITNVKSPAASPIASVIYFPQNKGR